MTVNETARVAFPVPLLVFVNVTVSVKFPGSKVLALELIVAVTVVLPPAAMVPLVVESVSQLAVLAAVQFRAALPLLVRV